MNLARGFKRVLVVATLIYWGVAASSAFQTYDISMSNAKGSGLFCKPDPKAPKPGARASWRDDPIVAPDKGGGALPPGMHYRDLDFSSRATCAFDQARARKSAISDVMHELADGAVVYAALAAAIAALWWIVAGFRSSRAPR